MKLFRRVEAGLNPDLEIGRYLTDQQHFASIPAVAGALEYHRGKDEPATLAILQAFVPNQGDTWVYTLDTLSHYFERIVSEYAEREDAVLPDKLLLDMIDDDMPPLAYDLLEHYAESARRLGQRTAEMHLALSASVADPAFTPEPFTAMYQRSIYQTMRSQAGRVFQSLRKVLHTLPETARQNAQEVSTLDEQVNACFRTVLNLKVTALRTRCHGDYHLGQVLFTGNDFMIIDFEGEPARSLIDRRRKRSPLTDVAGMLRSFHYAAHTALFNEIESGIVHPEYIVTMQHWAQFWYLWVSATFLRSYFETSGEAPFIPKTREETRALLNAYLMDKAVYELGYELNNRPTWVRIPVWGILHLLNEQQQ
jgi:maltose alpha-D-glucosyltransferase/alpha-amylase